MKDSKKKSIIGIIFTTIIILFTLIILFSVISSRVKGKDAKIFGYSFHIVVSGSMEPEIMIGDFVVAKTVKFEDLKLGDYIIYKSPSNIQNGERILHEIIEIDYENDSIKTKGINNPVEDDYTVKSSHLLGKHVIHSTIMGNIIIWLSQIKNLVFLAVIAFAGFIIFDQVSSIIKQVKEKNKTSNNLEIDKSKSQDLEIDKIKKDLESDKNKKDLEIDKIKKDLESDNKNKNDNDLNN